MPSFPLFPQHDSMDCGPTCLRMVAAHYGRRISAARLRELCLISREGVSLLGISEAAEKLGMRTTGVQISIEKLKEDVPLPCVIHWNQNHFVVLHKVKRKKNATLFYVADPAGSLITYTEAEFKRCWLSAQNNDDETGVVLCLEPTPDFYAFGDDKDEKSDRHKFTQNSSTSRSLIVNIC